MIRPLWPKIVFEQHDDGRRTGQTSTVDVHPTPARLAAFAQEKTRPRSSPTLPPATPRRRATGRSTVRFPLITRPKRTLPETLPEPRR